MNIRTEVVEEVLAGGPVDQNCQQHDPGREEEDAVAGVCCRLCGGDSIGVWYPHTHWFKNPNI